MSDLPEKLAEIRGSTVLTQLHTKWLLDAAHHIRAAETLIEQLQRELNAAEWAMTNCSGTCGHSYRDQTRQRQ